MTPQEVIDLRRRHLLPGVVHFYRDPPLFVRGEGCWLVAEDGRRFFDAYTGVSVHALGHCHPALAAAAAAQAQTLTHTTTILLTRPIAELAGALAGLLPGDATRRLTRTFFCASGSEANETAALLARLHTRRRGLLALGNSLHGRTALTLALTGLAFWRIDPFPPAEVRHVPPPICRACPWGRRAGACDLACVAAVEAAFVDGEAPAALFAEPVQGNGGIEPLPAAWWQGVRAACDRHGVLLVADEVQTGFGRTGRMFAIEHAGVVPDLLTGGKALGGGTPIGFVSATEAVAGAHAGRPGASTFGGNALTAVSALAFLRTLAQEDAVARAADTGAWFAGRLRDLASRHRLITDVRGLGLMQACELGAAGALTPAQTLDAVLEDLKDRGFLAGKTGPSRNVLTFLPPLISRREDLDALVAACDAALTAVEGRR